MRWYDQYILRERRILTTRPPGNQYILNDQVLVVVSKLSSNSIPCITRLLKWIGSLRTPLLCSHLSMFPQTWASYNCLLTMILSKSNLHVAFKVCEQYLVTIQFYSQLWSNTVLPQLWPGLLQEFFYTNTGPLDFTSFPQDGLLIWNIFILLLHPTSTIT